MSKLFILTALLCFFQVGYATNYYFSSTAGNDHRSPAEAQQPGTPWKTLQKLTAFFPQLQPGDTVFLKRGDVFDGSITAARSGAAQRHIVITAYGSGSKPLINGFAPLTQFASQGDNVWWQSFPKTQPNVLLVNNVQQPLGRFPNAGTENGGYRTFTTRNGTTSITDNSLSSATNWTGAELVIRKNRWVLDRGPITAHNGSTLTYNISSTNVPPVNFGYFIQNHLSTLDKDGEWYFDNSKKRLYLYKNNYSPATTSVIASAVDTLITVNHHGFITISDLAFRGANLNAISLSNTRFITITDCDISYTGLNGIWMTAVNDIVVANCRMQYNTNNAITTQWNNCRNIRISNNDISNTGIFPGMGKTGDLSYQAVIVKGKNTLVENNRIDSTGYIPIRFEGDSCVVQNNFITTFCFVKDDGAGIYTWNSDFNAPENTHRVVKDNIILNGIGAGAGTSYPDKPHAHGIYLDDNSANVDITGNTVAHCGESGIYIHNSRKTTIRNNTLYNNNRQLYLQHDNISPTKPVRDLTVKENIFFSKSGNQDLLHTRSIKDDVPQFGTADNNYFSRPLSPLPSIYTAYTKDNREFVQAYTLKTWQGAFGKDKASKPEPVVVAPYQISAIHGNNKILNATFDAGIGNIYGYFYAGSYKSEWNKGGKLDGGCLQLTLDASNNNRGFVMMNVGPVTAGRVYVLRFSLLGSSNNKSISAFVRKTGAPYTRLSGIGHASVLTGRTENELLFIPSASESAATILFDFSDQKTLWLDNIQFHEATVSFAQPDEHLRFEYNPSANRKTVVLDGTYVDAKGEIYQGAVTLAPFTSVVLTRTKAAAKASQTIDFPSIGNKLSSDEPFLLEATASSGLPVSYRVVSGPATVAGNRVTLTGEGTVILEALQEGNASFLSAVPVEQQFTVTKQPSSTRKKQTIDFGTLDFRVFGSEPFPIGAEASSGLPVSFRVVSGPATITGHRVTMTGAGFVTLEATQEGNELYEVADAVRRSFTVGKAAQTIQFAAPENKTLGDEPFLLTAETSSGLPVSFSVVSGSAFIVDNHITLTGAGTITLAAIQPGDANFQPALTISRSFTVAPRPAEIKQDQSILFSALDDRTFGDDAFSLEANASSNLPVAYRVVSGPATVEEAVVTITGAGVVTIEASQQGNQKYQAATPVVQAFTVAKAEQYISFAPINSKQLSEQVFLLVATASSGLPVDFRVLSGPGVIYNGIVTLTGPGTLVVEAMQAGNKDYQAAAPETQEFSLSTGEKKNQTIKFGTLGYKTYNSPAFELAAETSSGLPVRYQVLTGPVTITGNMVTITGVGKVSIAAWQEGNDEYNEAKPVVRSFTVGKASQVLSFPMPADVTTSEVSVTLTAEASSGLPVKYRVVSGPATISGDVVFLKGKKGTVVITASQPGNEYFSATYSLVRSFIVTAGSHAYSDIYEDEAMETLNVLKAPAPEGHTTPTHSIQVFPNPVASNGSLVITLAQTVEAPVEIYNAAGKLVKRIAKQPFQNGQPLALSLDVSAWRSGTYFIRLAIAGRVISKQFQVVK